jgi:hypothetical protein
MDVGDEVHGVVRSGCIGSAPFICQASHHRPAAAAS